MHEVILKLILQFLHQQHIKDSSRIPSIPTKVPIAYTFSHNNNMKVIQEYLFKTLWGLTTSFLGCFDRQPNQRALCCFSSWCYRRCHSWCYSWISSFLLGSKECTCLPKTTTLFESSRSHHRNCPPFVDSSRTTGSRVRQITMVRCALSFFNETKLITIGVGWEQLFMSWMTRNSRQKSIGNPSLCGTKLAIGHTATNTA